LLSNLENSNAKGSPKYNNAFAKALAVDPHWLAYGTGVQPRGFTEDEVKKIRAWRAGGPPLERALRISIGRTPEPKWQAEPEPSLEQAANLQDSITTEFMRYSRLVGPDNARRLIALLTHVVDNLLATPHAGRENNVTVEQGNRRTGD